MEWTLQDCRIVQDETTLRLEAGGLLRVYDWNQGHLRTQSIRLDGQPLNIRAVPDADFHLPGKSPAQDGGSALEVRIAEGCPGGRSRHIVASISCAFEGGLRVRRVIRLVPGLPVIAGEVWFLSEKGGGLESAVPLPEHAAMMAQLESLAERAAGRLPSMDCLPLVSPHAACRAVQFFDVTDRRNNLVREWSFIPYRSPLALQGSLLTGEDRTGEHAWFWLKEAPCSDVQLGAQGCDFLCRIGEYRMIGPGVGNEDLAAGQWVRGYGFAFGVAPRGGSAPERLLRRYLQALHPLHPDRDLMILQNTWGDRGQDSRMGEAFALREVEFAARLGCTHLQLDDGWQKGQSSNSASQGGTLNGIWQRQDYWDVHPQRFPGGLEPVLRKARELGIELCLWFNPSKDDHYASWEKDADLLIALHRRYGVRTFKIDGVDIPDKRAETNLRAMLDRVMEATNGMAVFNLDVTAGRRFGYFHFTEYGNKFLENRYTDWNNHYPYWTHRNLWQLCRYVPPAWLQIEFLNIWRNANRYAADDPLAPSRVPFPYAVALTLAAQPLAWLEGANLPPEAFRLARPLINAWKPHRRAFHEGIVLPVGQEPSGTGWTGFQSHDDAANTGYAMIYREFCDQGKSAIRLHLPAGTTTWRFDRIAGAGRSGVKRRAADGTVTFSLPRPWSFAIYRYAPEPRQRDAQPKEST